jgi:hypothetical protein
MLRLYFWVDIPVLTKLHNFLIFFSAAIKDSAPYRQLKDRSFMLQEDPLGNPLLFVEGGRFDGRLLKFKSSLLFLPCSEQGPLCSDCLGESAAHKPCGKKF